MVSSEGAGNSLSFNTRVSGGGDYLVLCGKPAFRLGEEGRHKTLAPRYRATAGGQVLVSCQTGDVLHLSILFPTATHTTTTPPLASLSPPTLLSQETSNFCLILPSAATNRLQPLKDSQEAKSPLSCRSRFLKEQCRVTLCLGRRCSSRTLYVNILSESSIIAQEGPF